MTYKVSYGDPVTNRLRFQKDYSYLPPLPTTLASEKIDEVDVDEQRVEDIRRDFDRDPSLKAEGSGSNLLSMSPCLPIVSLLASESHSMISNETVSA